MIIADAQNAETFTILVVDDSPLSLALTADLLSSHYRCRVATSGLKALFLAEKEPQPDLILLDILMPDPDGYEVCRSLKENSRTQHIPVLFFTTLSSFEDEAKGFAVGAVDFITKPVNKTVLLARVGAQLALVRSQRLLSNKNLMLESMIQQRSRQLTAMRDVIILGIAALAETREGQSNANAHVRRIQLFTRELALALRHNPCYAPDLDDHVLEILYKTSPLHDIGKIGVPDSILFKPDKLSVEEFEAMKRHSLIGGLTLKGMERQLRTPEAFVAIARDIALYHHERWDGTGYPMGLKGENIPLSARIVALADTYDALTSRRIYKAAHPVDEVTRIIQAEQGKQFDPAVVAAFFRCESNLRAIARTHADASYTSTG